MVKITDRNGRVIECQDAAEAIAVLRYLHREEQKASGALVSPVAEFLTLLAGGNAQQTPYWTRELFWKFVDDLSETQQAMLSALVQRHKVSDDEMRKIANVRTNLELGGVLSGVSKQAAAHNIPARAVYTIENESQSGETQKTYVVALDFLRIASEMNWPG